MAVPPDYSNTNDYLDDVMEFLKIYNWVYNFPNTHILVNKVLDRFPTEWLQFFSDLSIQELNDLSRGRVPANAPSCLQGFFAKVKKLGCPLEKITFDETFNFPKNSGLRKKKQHEIVCLAPLVHETCTKSSCDFILDVGTGLGYLPRLLYDKYGLRTLGIEGDSEKIKLAQLHEKKCLKTKDAVQYFEHTVTSESDQQIQEILEGMSTANRVCLTALHACADLSVTVLELFNKMSIVKAMVVMPCCYHRLKEGENGFENFPVSNEAKKLWRKYEAKDFLSVPFLRMACQSSADRFSTLSEHQHLEEANSCLFRAILEDVVVQENYQVKRLKRKSGKLKHSPSTEAFEAYLANLKHTHALIGGEITDHQFLVKMREKWTQHKGNAYLIQGLAAIQAAMQNVCENVVLLDRVMFLREKGVQCFVVKVTDQRISPRGHALVAMKP